MDKYTEINGDLIKFALKGKFDVICHGCNCQVVMGAGIAPQMAKAFGADLFDKQHDHYLSMSGVDQYFNINKLGTIDYFTPYLDLDDDRAEQIPENLIVINAYTQYDFTGRKKGEIDLDYNALRLCMKKINHIFKGKHIGLPQIGAGLAGGSWDVIKQIIQSELKDMNVTVVIFKK